jgi:hypothetical protein
MEHFTSSETMSSTADMRRKDEEREEDVSMLDPCAIHLDTDCYPSHCSSPDDPSRVESGDQRVNAKCIFQGRCFVGF